MKSSSLAAPPSESLIVAGFARIDEDLPVFTGSSWEEHIQAWLDAESTVSGERWKQAAVAHSLTTHYGENSIEEFAHQIGINPKRVWEYRAAYRLYQNSGRPENLDFTHYLIASSSREPEKMIELAAEESLSTRQLKRLVTAASAPALDETIPALSDDPEVIAAWELFQTSSHALKTAAPRLTNLINGYLEEIQYELSLPAESIRQHIFQAIEQGVDEIDLIAQQLKRNRIHVATWINRLCELGELESWEKGRLPGARGATRTGYRIPA